MPNPILAELFEAIDAMNVDRFASCLSIDALFRFGSAPQVQGQGAIREAIGGFFSTISGLRHDLHKSFDDGNTLVIEGAVTYTRHDGSEITLPFANILEVEDGLISNYKIYADIGPLYAP